MNPDQLTLGVSEPRARHDDPDTSRDAAESGSRSELEAEILRTIGRVEWTYQQGIASRGMTDDEVCRFIDAFTGRELHWPTVKTARSRLSKAGLLVDSGFRRPSQRGRDQIVWALAP